MLVWMTKSNMQNDKEMESSEKEGKVDATKDKEKLKTNDQNDSSKTKHSLKIQKKAKTVGTQRHLSYSCPRCTT